MSASSTPTAILFPGQGSQQPGMREPTRAVLPELVELADELCDGDPFARADEGTRFQQPALYCAALAAWEGLRELEPVALAGHSLGEITALAAAGALSHEDGLRLVAARGRLMQEAADASDGGMMAVRGSRAEVEPRVRESGAGRGQRQLAAPGGPGRRQRRPRRPGRPARQAPARGRRVPLAADAAGGRGLPRGAGPRRSSASRAVPVISCVTARPFEDPRDELAAALTSPVRWVDVLGTLQDRGVRRFVETGPGSVLTGLVRKTLDDAEAVAAHA